MGVDPYPQGGVPFRHRPQGGVLRVRKKPCWLEGSEQIVAWRGSAEKVR